MPLRIAKAMNLSKIKLTNFKCFKSLDIDCPAFTVLTGANSSGKSSVIVGLLGALQTKNFPFYYSPNGSFVNMGDFTELAHGHDQEAEVGICLHFGSGSANEVVFQPKFVKDASNGLPRLQILNYSRPEFTLEVQGHPRRIAAYNFTSTSSDLDAMSKSHPEYVGFFEQLEKLMKLGVVASGPTKLSKGKRQSNSGLDWKSRFFSCPRSGSFQFTDINGLLSAMGDQFIATQIDQITGMVNNFSRNFNYISSFRLSPDRTYYQRTKSAIKVDKYGENWVDQVLEWEHSSPEKYKQLKEVCTKLGLIRNIKAHRQAGGRYELRVETFAGSIDSALADVGFGVSQFLPILVADLQLGKRSTLAVSQPEIHLHPSIQADYINHLVSNAKKQSKRYIIETHSEYMINRFRLLISQGRIKSEDVAVYFLDNDRGVIKSYRIKLCADGSIEGAPKSFFKTYMMDMMKIALYAEA
jgi:predicted ATPase